FSPAKLRSRLRNVGSVRGGWPLTYTVGAESLCTWNVEFPSFVRRLRFTSPIWFDGQAGVVVHEQFVCEYPSVPSLCGMPIPPASPGRPGWPNGSVTGWPSVLFTAAWSMIIEHWALGAAHTAGLTYLAPYSAW